ncbi:MAG: hypothetical protein ACI857_000387 [Arenicella sp.]|jgi:hypothetical protein
MKNTIAKDLKEIYPKEPKNFLQRYLHARTYSKLLKNYHKTLVKLSQAGKHTAVENTNIIQGKIGTEHKIGLSALDGLDAKQAS